MTNKDKVLNDLCRTLLKFGIVDLDLHDWEKNTVVRLYVGLKDYWIGEKYDEV